ncbi:MAG: hypothetical protein ABID04_01910 [Patescibacteria group bacterium]
MSPISVEFDEVIIGGDPVSVLAQGVIARANLAPGIEFRVGDDFVSVYEHKNRGSVVVENETGGTRMGFDFFEDNPVTKALGEGTTVVFRYTPRNETVLAPRRAPPLLPNS